MPQSDQQRVTLPKQAVSEILFVVRNAEKAAKIAEYSEDPSFEKASAALSMSPVDIRKILEVFVNLRRLQSRYGWSDEVLFAAIPSNIERQLGESEQKEVLKRWELARHQISEAFKRLSNDHPLTVLVLSEQISYLQEKLCTNVRIITEIRPVFDDAGMKILRATASHELVIDFWHGQNPERIQIALDASDLMQLKHACERAERKAATIKDSFKALPWPTTVLAESDDSTS